MNTINRPESKIELTADLLVEMDQVGFNISAKDDAVIISVQSFSEVVPLIRKIVVPLIRNKERWVAIQRILKRTDMTVYMQNRSLGIYGPKANPLLNSLLLRFASN